MRDGVIYDCPQYLMCGTVQMVGKCSKQCIDRWYAVHIRKPKPQTNADRIRAMSDEELAVFLRTVEYDVEQFPFIQDWDKWLKEPAEGE